MTQNSYPKVEAPFSDHEWKQLFLTLGRGVIDKGGSPYKLTARDSVTDMVTIGVASTTPALNSAVLDGFLHTMDAAEDIYIAPVSVDTNYEIGLVYDPAQHGAVGGPITLTAWVAPGDNSGGRSRMVLYRMTRKKDLALGSTPYTAEVPRAVPVISVSQTSQLPTNSLVLVDTIGVIRTTGDLYRADISDTGAVSWSKIGGSDITSSDIDAKINDALGSGWVTATPYPTAHSIVRRWDSGVIRVGTSTTDAKDALNREAADSRYPLKSHTHTGADITSRIPFEHVDGSLNAYNNTNLGSTWVTVAANNDGFFGRYPSALKYKKNVRMWNLSPETVFGLTPVKYEDNQSGDTRVGFVADSYTTTLPEMVETNPDTGEVEGWRYMLTCVAQQIAIRDLNERAKAQAAEIATLKFNQTEILAYLGLTTDADGRVITTESGV